MNDKNQPVVMEMDIQNEQGHALVEFRNADETYAILTAQTSELDANSVSQFNHLLGLAPSSAAAIASSSKQLMTCTFEYGRLVQTNYGSGAIGAVYREGSTKFGAQARFHEAKNLKSLVNTGLVMNIASQVFAQKHLADINERLKAIEQQVKNIQKHLEQSRFAKIEAFQEHLVRVGELLRLGDDVRTDTLNLLANNTLAVRADVKHVLGDLTGAHQEISDFDSSSLFGSNDLRVALMEKIERVGHLQREYMLGMQCLLVANLMLFVKFYGNKEYVRAGEDYLTEWNSEQGPMNKWNDTKRRIDLHLSKMKPTFELSKSTMANAQLVEAKVTKVQQMIEQDDAQVRRLQQRLVQAQKPRVLLELEGGQVVRGHYLP